MARGICKNCKKEKEIAASGKSEGLCNVCYRKLIWKPKLVKCPRCERTLPHHAKGLCVGCYNSVFNLENIKEWNARIYHNLEPELYKKVIEKCVICKFNNVVELHHLDHNKKNNSQSNLIGLCPNHHKMIHNRIFRKEILSILKEKGFNPPKGYKDDEFFK